MTLSIIIPVLNEEDKIISDVRAAIDFMKKNSIEGEIIVVDDGSIDDTQHVVERFKESSYKELRLIHYQPNQGKGFAVRTGVEASRGDIVAFIDSGLCIPYNEIKHGIQLITEKGADIAIASRYMEGSCIVKKKGLLRRMLSFIFRKLITLLMNTPAKLSDTQCGLKLFKGPVAKKLFEKSIVNGFMFDIEILLLATQDHYSIVEFPVTWTSDPDSRLSLSRNFFKMLSELISIKRRLG